MLAETEIWTPDPTLQYAVLTLLHPVATAMAAALFLLSARSVVQVETGTAIAILVTGLLCPTASVSQGEMGASRLHIYDAMREGGPDHRRPIWRVVEDGMTEIGTGTGPDLLPGSVSAKETGIVDMNAGGSQLRLARGSLWKPHKIYHSVYFMPMFFISVFI